MQKSGLLDTMSDMIIDAIGAMFVSAIGFIALKSYPKLSSKIRKSIKKRRK